MSIVITNILQEINGYMKANNNQMGELDHTSLKLGTSHHVNIALNEDKIRAIVTDMSEWII